MLRLRRRAGKARRKELLDELRRIRDDAVDRRLKVGGPEWEAVLLRCRQIRSDLGMSQTSAVTEKTR